MQIYSEIYLQLASQTNVVNIEYVRYVCNYNSDFSYHVVECMIYLPIFLPEFLHRAADLTLVPSVAIAKDLEAARVTAGEIYFSLVSFS